MSNFLHLHLVEEKNGIIFQITHVDLLAKRGDIGMLANKKPSHVREEEATFAIMWICVCVGEFVMYTMISHPLYDIFLCR